MGILLLTLIQGAAEATCPDPAERADQAEQAIVRARFDDARARIDEGISGFACGPLADSGALGRLWRAEGAAYALQGDDDAAKLAFQAAARVDRGAWTTAFGEDLKKKWEEAGIAPAGTAGLIRLDPPPIAWIAALDGKEVPFPTSPAGGMYLVQAGPPGGPMAWSKIVVVPAGETVSLPLPPEAAATPATTTAAAAEPATSASSSSSSETAAAPPSSGSHRRVGFILIGAGATAALAGTTAALAVAQDGVMQDAADTAALDAAFGRQQTLAYATYGLAGLAAAGAVLFFVW